jgi:hypothetical protein
MNAVAARGGLVTASDGEVMVDREILEDVMREFIAGVGDELANGLVGPEGAQQLQAKLDAERTARLSRLPDPVPTLN